MTREYYNESDCKSNVCAKCIYRGLRKKQDPYITDLQAKYDALKQSHEKLMEYTQHKPDCELIMYRAAALINNRPPKCNCGLTQVLAEAGGCAESLFQPQKVPMSVRELECFK
jgi:hypothetical protein